MSTMVIMRESAGGDDVARACARVQEAGAGAHAWSADGVIAETRANLEHALCDGPRSLPTSALPGYADRVPDLARRAGKDG